MTNIKKRLPSHLTVQDGGNSSEYPVGDCDFRRQRLLKLSAWKWSGLPPPVVIAGDVAQGVEPGAHDGCRLMLELTGLGKQQTCFALGATSHPCSIVWGLTVSDPVEEQADWEGWSSRKAGSWLQDFLPCFFLPALGCWCPTPHAGLLGVFLWPHIPVGWWLDSTAPVLRYHILAITFISSWCWSTMGCSHVVWQKAGDGGLQEQGTGSVRGQNVIIGIATFPQSIGAGDFGKTSQSWKGRYTLQFVLGRWSSICSIVTAQN